MLWTLLAIFIPNAIGIILYFILRDPVPVPCPACGTPAKKGQAYCAGCGTAVRAACPQCRPAGRAGLAQLHALRRVVRAGKREPFDKWHSRQNQPGPRVFARCRTPRGASRASSAGGTARAR